MSSESFTSEMKLEKLYKIEEMKNWFLLYTTNKVAQPIPKNNLTPDQVTQVRNIFIQLRNVKLKIKK